MSVSTASAPGVTVPMTTGWHEPADTDGGAAASAH